MMRNIFILIAILPFIHSKAQDINYCKYFSLVVSETMIDSKITQSYSPEINATGADEFSLFLRHHENRFSYLLWNKMDGLDRIATLFPDTLQLIGQFCQSLTSNKTLIQYFKNLTPNTLTNWDIKKATFSIAEMMEVASRYFYPDRMNEKDTTIISHICVGLNGQGESEASLDLTLLEAFTFEGIFYYLLQDDPPQFELNFYDCINHSLAVHKKKFTTFDSLLYSVRKDCNDTMIENKDLKQRLVKYYNRNKNNLNFWIKADGS